MSCENTCPMAGICNEIKAKISKEAYTKTTHALFIKVEEKLKSSTEVADAARKCMDKNPESCAIFSFPSSLIESYYFQQTLLRHKIPIVWIED